MFALKTIHSFHYGKPRISNLLDLPVFVMHAPWLPERLKFVIPNIKKAGFHNITVWEGINGKNKTECANEWRRRGFDPDSFEIMGSIQGYLLSQLLFLEKMITEKMDMFVHFEDDIVFHSDWHKLWPLFWGKTPEFFDMVNIGGSIDAPYEELQNSQKIVGSWPTLNANALVISQDGAQYIYDLLLRKLGEGQRVNLDTILWEEEKSSQEFDFYVYNTVVFPDTEYMKNHVMEEAGIITGLVFQETQLFPSTRYWAESKKFHEIKRKLESGEQPNEEFCGIIQEELQKAKKVTTVQVHIGVQLMMANCLIDLAKQTTLVNDIILKYAEAIALIQEIYNFFGEISKQHIPLEHWVQHTYKIALNNLKHTMQNIPFIE